MADILFGRVCQERFTRRNNTFFFKQLSNITNLFDLDSKRFCINFSINIIIGLLSSIVDNVPLVAASIGMFPNPIDDPLWHGIAFSAGTGGSMLIIGSAAGVVAMGMQKIDFFWYIKKITLLAMIGFWAGYGTFMIFRDFLL